MRQKDVKVDKEEMKMKQEKRLNSDRDASRSVSSGDFKCGLAYVKITGLIGKKQSFNFIH